MTVTASQIRKELKRLQQVLSADLEDPKVAEITLLLEHQEKLVSQMSREEQVAMAKEVARAYGAGEI